jgi:photosynthetic reaction center cytochrome c subunit
MLLMTQEINSEWNEHVSTTGVTCYTCHRGRNVPENIWFNNPGPRQAAGFTADSAGQNTVSTAAGKTSLPFDPFSRFLGQKDQIRVVSTQALPAGNPRTIKDTEWTYSLMMHMSESLGVNCTFCHNSRSFFQWDGSTPQRATAWHGIQMVGELNAGFLKPLTEAFPDIRLGPLGDVAKINCGTCHQGVSKPLFGANMLEAYPSLAPKR